MESPTHDPDGQITSHAEPAARGTQEARAPSPGGNDEASGTGAPQNDDQGASPSPGRRDSWGTRLVRQHPRASLATLTTVVVIAICGYLYLDYADRFESTDDAFIAARNFAVAPEVSGYLTHVNVTDNQHIRAGDVIARVDDRPYRIALEQADARVDAGNASIAQAKAQIEVQKAKIAATDAQLTEAQAALVFAQEQATRYQKLAKDGWGPIENAQEHTSQFHQQEAAVQSARASLVLAQRQMLSLEAQLKSADANLSQAKAARDKAELDLSYTTVTAAQSGHVVQLSAAVGELAEAGTDLSMFVPDEIWVTANFKETQLDKIRPGQRANLEVDAYPERVFHGHVASIQSGSGTAFSLLPAENATGNYIKIVQRVPVKIIIDDPPNDVALGPGMSVVPTVRINSEPSLYERLGSWL
ncbi:HlyD family secretion protein [Methyloceanibacter caenitepidi]|uniref:Membrane fusion component of tripartite multidrug resistance system n=1 Tax=Methyloceanibacter caenitepidi TaxID=1384459 RepID=A0A0A8K3R0_9HYPH|nr:HlyD family secretion protein [Methyloceanibacter caenitepidi]BAQ16639.1 membrane fusion component of tripartite multidrug resistance system [Methyloceanibacter caenitepidi]